MGVFFSDENLQITADGKQSVIGTFRSDGPPFIPLDLEYAKNVQISHTSKNCSIYFCGYKTKLPIDVPGNPYMEDSDSDFSYEEEDSDRGRASGMAKKKVKAFREVYSIGQCIAVLEMIPGVSSTSYTNALSFFLEIDWRKIFLMMSPHRKKEWLHSLGAGRVG